ncbi:holo-ACP synthase [Candidatus Sumerlaeota bacterium]|nr:holo-ACP synthase [Candidatus Sumerlaeota bacterium]
MIVGLGIDIVSIERIAAMLERHGGRAAARLYTETERAYCESMAKPALHYAARFAAKEAFVKALGTGFSSGIRWRDIGIVHDAKGKPEIVVEGQAGQAMGALGADRSYVSLSHDPLHAAAVVVLEKS